VVGDATSLSFEDGWFDAAISSDFHEHLDDDQQHAVLSEALRVLKPAGRLVVKTPNLTYLRLSTLFKRAREVAAGRDPRRVVIPHSAGTEDPQHIGLTTRAKLEAQLARAGFDEVRFFYEPLRRFGVSRLATVLSTEVPVVRDAVCEDVFCVARKPIARSFFPS
jgi:SAM-dependent methyltransferase